ncbi:MAG: hypothetical protein OXM88_09330 [bacterium]|nr:hypothetical protein [bacterium]
MLTIAGGEVDVTDDVEDFQCLHGSSETNPDRSTIDVASGFVVLRGVRWAPGQSADYTIAQLSTPHPVRLMFGMVALWEGWADTPDVFYHAGGLTATRYGLRGRLVPDTAVDVAIAEADIYTAEEAWEAYPAPPRLLGSQSAITWGDVMFRGAAGELASWVATLGGRLVGEDRLGRLAMPSFLGSADVCHLNTVDHFVTEVESDVQSEHIRNQLVLDYTGSADPTARVRDASWLLSGPRPGGWPGTVDQPIIATVAAPAGTVTDVRVESATVRVRVPTRIVRQRSGGPGVITDTGLRTVPATMLTGRPEAALSSGLLRVTGQSLRAISSTPQPLAWSCEFTMAPFGQAQTSHRTMYPSGARLYEVGAQIPDAILRADDIIVEVIATYRVAFTFVGAVTDVYEFQVQSSIDEWGERPVSWPMWIANANLRLPGAARPPHPVLFMSATGPTSDLRMLFTVDVTTGEATLRGRTTDTVFGMTWHNGRLYGVVQSYPGPVIELVIMDIATGSLTTVGSATNFGVGETRPVGLASHEGTLYMVGSALDALFTLDATTGVATRVGSANRFGVRDLDPAGLASHAGTLYMVGRLVNTGNGSLFTLDATTGVATRVGSAASFGSNEGFPRAIASHEGTLYMVGSALDALFTLDATTGVATRVGSADRLGVLTTTQTPLGLASGEETSTAPLPPSDGSAARLIQDTLDHLSQARTYYDVSLPLWQETAEKSAAVAAIDYGTYIDMAFVDDIRGVLISEMIALVTSRSVEGGGGRVPTLVLRCLDIGEAGSPLLLPAPVEVHVALGEATGRAVTVQRAGSGTAVAVDVVAEATGRAVTVQRAGSGTAVAVDVVLGEADSHILRSGSGTEVAVDVVLGEAGGDVTHRTGTGTAVAVDVVLGEAGGDAESGAVRAFVVLGEAYGFVGEEGYYPIVLDGAPIVLDGIPIAVDRHGAPIVLDGAPIVLDGAPIAVD